MGEIKDVENYINNKYKNIIIKKRGSLADNKPNLSKEWDYERNYPLTPKDVTTSSKIRVWWKCIYGHEWEASIGNRTNGKGCPVCAKEIRTSFPEQAIFYYLKKAFPKAENEILIENNEVDIFLPDYKIGIEYDGCFYHEKRQQQEIKKYEVLKKLNIYLIRIRENGIQPVPNSCDFYILSKYVRNNFEELDKTINNLICKISELTQISLNKIIINCEKDISKIQKSFFQNKKEKSIYNKMPSLIGEWDLKKNNGITPEMVYASDNRKYWWICNRGHSYMMSPNNRKNGRSCPYCSNHEFMLEYNDLKTVYPNLANEFDVEKNKITPSLVSSSGNKKYWWICSKGHSYNSLLYNRIIGHGCPYCSKRIVSKGENDIKTINPEFMSEWNYEKNTDISPNECSIGSGKVVWWKCNSCGNEWKASINSRNRGRGCPKCGLKKIGELKSKKVYQLSLDGNVIAEYNSITEAEKTTGIKHISNVCRKERRTAGGYIWKYKQEKG